MATTLSHLPLPPSWEESRPHSQLQPQPDIQKRQRSPNHVKARPANPLVINSILDSFDALQSPSILTSDDAFSDTPSRRTRPHTANERGSRTSSLATSASPGFGLEYGNGLSMNYEVGISDVALPPTIPRTSRDSSPTSVYKAARPPSIMSVQGHERRRSSSIGSYSSFSLMRKEKDRPGKYKLSSESWVKQGPASPASLSNDWPRDDEKRNSRRESSEDSVRPPKSRIEIISTPSTPSNLSTNLSRAEQIIALASAPRSTGSKQRLYLTDTGSVEDHLSVLESPASIAEEPQHYPDPRMTLPQVDENVDSIIEQILDDHVKMEEEQMIPTRRSPRRTSIVDSIPMRTSSLRQSSSSPAPGKRKGRKSKRQSEIGRMAKLRVGAERDSFVSSTSSKEIPDSSWDDLGEDDETVRRILELREQRKARMLEPPRSPARGLSPSAKSDISSAPTSDGRSVGSVSGKGSPELRPVTSRRVTEPVVVSKLLRTEIEVPAPSPKRLLEQRQSLDVNSASRRLGDLATDAQKPPLRPATSDSKSSSPRLSLEYSYVDAVESLHGIRPSTSKGDVEQSVQPTPLPPPPLSSPATPLRPTDATPAKASTARSASTATLSKTFRWRAPTQQHPDLPLEYDKKGHFRSTSLGNSHNSPTIVDQQRASVDLAVTSFLQAGRLSHKIKHPLTGRSISFSEVGDPDGAAVIICLGMGLTRYVSAFYDELAATLHLRLITIDRPGVGASEPYPQNDKSGPLSWPDDVLAVCQHLGITKFSMLAHSAGAIYALATALILPHLIRGKLHLLSPWIPPSQLGVISNPQASVAPGGTLPRSQRILRILPTPFFKAANASFMTTTSASLRPNATREKRNRTELRRQGPITPPDMRPSTDTGRGNDAKRRESMMLMDQFMPELNPTDNFPLKDPPATAKPSERASTFTAATANPMDPAFAFASTGLNAAQHLETARKLEYTSILTQRTWDLATRDSNPANDLLICLERHRDIGFRYTDVHQEVVITHGAEDRRVPVGNVRWLAEQMNRHSVAFGSGKHRGPAGSRDGLVGGGCEMRVLEGEGHGLMASPRIMGDILTEIAGYTTTQGR